MQKLRLFSMQGTFARPANNCKDCEITVVYAVAMLLPYKGRIMHKQVGGWRGLILVMYWEGGGGALG